MVFMCFDISVLIKWAVVCVNFFDILQDPGLKESGVLFLDWCE